MEAASGSQSSVTEKRRLALFDFLYVLVHVWLYVFSLFYPLVGIILGIVLMSAASTEEVRRAGRVCLILGIVNAVLLLVALVILIAFGSFFGSLPFARGWGGL